MESFIGYIKTPQDALVIFEACQKGILPKVKRRLTFKERSDIRSGCIFVWDEREADMQRWTDGRTWSPSRVLGSFLTYQELTTKRRPRKLTHCYKINGLIKQSFSICTASNQKLHLISYYSKADVLSGKLKRPSDDLELNKIEIPKGHYPEINPLGIGGGHTASIYSMRQNSNSPSLISSPFSSDEESCYTQDLTFLPTQDVVLENLPCSEDYRQLNALRHQLRI